MAIGKSQIHAAAVRRHLLVQAKTLRAHKFTRVAEETLQQANRQVNMAIENVVQKHKPAPPPPEYNFNGLIHINAVKAAMVESAATQFGVTNFKVTPEMLAEVETKLDAWCVSKIKQLPSKGKTI